jgi:hypothetical protein
MNIQTILPESYQPRLYKYPDARVKCQIQQAEILPPAIVLSVEAAPGANAILLVCLTSAVVLEEQEMGSTD